jgi:hypothetical protein
MRVNPIRAGALAALVLTGCHEPSFPPEVHDWHCSDAINAHATGGWFLLTLTDYEQGDNTLLVVVYTDATNTQFRTLQFVYQNSDGACLSE